MFPPSYQINRRNTKPSLFFILLLSSSLLFIIALSPPVLGKHTKKHRKHRLSQHTPPPIHPVLLWAETLETSPTLDEKLKAAFKLSQYSGPIFQDAVVTRLLACLNNKIEEPDKDIKNNIRLLCVKALGNAGNQSHTDKIRLALIKNYQQNQAETQNIIIKTFIKRKDRDANVRNLLLGDLKNTMDKEHILFLLEYFSEFGEGDDFVSTLIDLYKRDKDTKIRRIVAEVLGDRAESHDGAIALLADCARGNETTLTLTCLASLQNQGKKDPRVWDAVSTTIMSNDPDVIMASVDLINVLAPNPSQKISERLIELIRTNDLDPDIKEKAILALGVAGDKSPLVIDELKKELLSKDTPTESIKIAAALILGKQGIPQAESISPLLASCAKEGSSSFKTACELARQELDEFLKKDKKGLSTQEPHPASY